MSKFQFIALVPSKTFGKLNKPAIAIAAARSGAEAIIDLSNTDSRSDFENSLLLLKHSVKDGKFGIRIKASDWKELNEEHSRQILSGLTVCISPSERFDEIAQDELGELIESVHARNSRIAIEVTSLQEAKLCDEAGVDILIAKGEESAGIVGSSTAFILTQQLVKECKVPVWTYGGIAEHTVAAVKAAGAQGAVLDSQLYLAADSQVPASLKRFIAQLDGSETTKEASDSGKFYRLLKTKSDSLLLGQDAALSAGLAHKGGTVCGIIDLLRKSAEEFPLLAEEYDCLKTDSPIARSHKTKYPIVQGAMTRVSDNSEFAKAVSLNGALPFLALSLMRGKEIESLLKETNGKLADLSWGVGILGFLPGQLRKEQIAVIKKYKPPFALIAGGRPDQAKQLEDFGIATYLHVPSPAILKSYIEQGAKRFVFEGNECGGHVGPRSSFILWEQMLNVLRENLPSGEKARAEYHILFAGGIHDALSAQMVATMAAPLSSSSVKVGVLIGTAYLYTKEAIKSGAIVEEFQSQALKNKDTVLLETGPGHAIRCIKSPYKEEFDEKKKLLSGQSKNKTAIKEELELLHLGRLRIASKGLLRKGTDLKPVSREEQWQKGMYMIGQLSNMKDKVVTMEELHENISTAGSKLLKQEAHNLNSTTNAISEEAKEPIAIIGMACNLPLSNDIETYWRNILEKVDAIEEVPKSHWRWEQLYNQDRFAEDKAISKWGGFLKDIVFNPSKYGIPPKSLASIDPVQLIMLEVVREALADAGYQNREFPRHKTSMILANAGHGPVAGRYALRSMLDIDLHDLLDETTKSKIRSRMPDWTEDSLPGNLSNVTAGRVTNRFDLGGTNFCVDAACASSLAALYVAMNDLRSNTSDLVVLGAADTHNNPIDFLNFSKTHALSQSGRCKTFDAGADGIVLGEGVAALILKRLSDAERDGDRIYALVKGVGSSSDGRALSLTAPRPEGQMTALERAYEDAKVSPSTVTLLEAHGTGTVAGDKAEVSALSEVFSKAGSQTNSCAIGSVKTNIGHTKCTAGLASTIKVAKSLFHKVLPATIGVNKPNPTCDFENNPFYINSQTRPWLHENESHPRRAGISAFGFGGTNFHTILEEYVPAIDSDSIYPTQTWPAELFVYRAKTKDSLKQSLNRTRKLLNSSKVPQSDCLSNDGRKLLELSWDSVERAKNQIQSPLTLALVASDLDDLSTKIDRAIALVEISNDATRGKEFSGIFYNFETSRPEQVAFLFPGQGAQRPEMLLDLALYFPEIRKQFEIGDRVAENYLTAPISSYVYGVPLFDKKAEEERKANLNATEVAQPAIGLVNSAVYKILASFGIKPDAVAGHSYGEYAALWAAGVFNEDDFVRLSFQRGMIFKAQGKAGSMLAVSEKAETVQKLFKSNNPGLVIANQNSPSQTIIAGPDEELEKFKDEARNHDFVVKPVPVSQAFHSPLMAEASKLLGDEIERVSINSPRLPVYSNTTTEAYPQKPNQIRKVLAKHTVEPVRFAQELENMYSQGIKTFIEVGPGTILTSLVKSNLTADDVTALSIDRAGKSGLVQLLSMLAELYTCGQHINFERLFDGRLDEDNHLANQPNSADPAKELLYKVNSVSITKINGAVHEPVLTKPEQQSQTYKQPAALPIKNRAQESLQNSLQGLKEIAPKSIGSVKSSDNGSVEEVLINYQKSMLSATESFIDAQKEVMLTYLQSQQQTKFPGSISNPVVRPEKKSVPKEEVVLSEDRPPENGGTENTQSQFELEKLIESLFEIVSERTGYPLEMLDPELDLEADLGIDSIKRIEIFNSFRKLLPESFDFDLQENIEELAELKSLAQISQWIRSLNPQENKISESKSRSLPQAITTIEDNSDSVHESGSTRREIVQLDKKQYLRAFDTKQFDSSASKNILVVRRKEDKFADQIEVLLTSSGTKVNVLFANQINEAVVLKHLLNEDCDELIHLADRKSLFQVAKAFKSAEVKKSDFKIKLVVGTRLGGNLIFEEDKRVDLNRVIEDSGLCGISNTIALEMPFVNCSYIDYKDCQKKNLKTTAMEFLAQVQLCESGGEYALANGKKLAPVVIPAALPESKCDDEPTIKLDQSSLILVTGGARGITAETTMALAQKYKCNLVIIGQSDEPERESQTTANLHSAKEIKAALMKEQQSNNGSSISIRKIESLYKDLIRRREIRANIKQLKLHANSVRYYKVDVRDEENFGNLINSLYELYGQIDGVVHGAGIIEDAYIHKKSMQSFERVFDTKVKGAKVLAENLKLDQLKFLYFFSSVVGRTGNPGQIDYVAANETLNKMARKLNTVSKSCSVKSIMWGPWQGGMAPPELKEIFESYGWGMLSPENGKQAFLNELALGNKAEPEVIIVGEPENSRRLLNILSRSYTGPVLRPASIVNNQPFEIRLPIELANHIYLEDHKLDSVPVLPMAMAIEIVLEAATVHHGGRVVRRLTDFDIPSGVVFDSESKLFEVKIEDIETNRSNVSISSVLPSGKLKLHHRGTIEFEENQDSMKTGYVISSSGTEVPLIYQPKATILDHQSDLPAVQAIYKDWMFHGKRFQGIDKIECLGSNGIAGSVKGQLPGNCLSDSGSNSWLLDPTLFDSAMQMGAVWARYFSDITCLPTGFKSMQFLRSLNSREVYVQVFTKAKTFDGEIVCDLAIYNQNKELAIFVDQLAGIGNKSFNRFANNPAPAVVS